MFYQFESVELQDNVCPRCMENEEDEIHILLQCPVYQDLRIRYLYPFNEPDNQFFIRIMSNDNSSYLQNLSLFLYHAFERRNNNLITLSEYVYIYIPSGRGTLGRCWFDVG